MRDPASQRPRSRQASAQVRRVSSRERVRRILRLARRPGEFARVVAAKLTRVPVIGFVAKRLTLLVNPQSAVLHDQLERTDDWPDLGPLASPFINGRRDRPKVLFINSMGGSMGRLSSALMLHEQIEADCFVNAYEPRRHLIFPHETIVQNAFSTHDWREFASWAVRHYDIVQTTFLPQSPRMAAFYDWLTDTLGRRHIWRTTGLIHHYIPRPDVLPLDVYQRDLGEDVVPSPDRFPCRSFTFERDHMLTDPHVVFYSSPEKGTYLKGNDTYWLPSIRDPEEFRPKQDLGAAAEERDVLIYVPHHATARWKGLDVVMRVLEELRRAGQPIRIVTAETAGTVFPDLARFTNGKDRRWHNSYPVPQHAMPELLRRVDLVVDQIVMGCYGNTGVEAMLCGKPVIGQKNYDDVRDCPVIGTNAGTLREVILKLLAERESWRDIGLRGREYALANHAPASVAARAAHVYRAVLDGR